MTKHVRRNKPSPEQAGISLFRGGQLVSTLTGAFGQSLRETRLTALLGYLMACRPKPFLDLFGFAGDPQEITIEARHPDGRSDIHVRTSAGVGVVEAKVDASDSRAQVRRYPAKWRVVLSLRQATPGRQRRVRNVTWRQLADILANLSATPSPRVRFLAADLRTYLEDHRMIPTQHSVEIYAREINEPRTLTLYLKGNLYICDHKRNSRLTEAKYFAPHFGRRIAKEHPGIAQGISHISRIDNVSLAATWKEFRSLVKERCGKHWMSRHREELKHVRRWRWNKNTPRNVLFLSNARLAFNPPLRKETLTTGKGWLARQFYSFDDLYKAWGP